MLMYNPSGRSKKYTRVFFTKDFWDAVASKIVETLVSVKVWGLISSMSVSTILLVNGYLTGGNWVATNTTIFSVIFGARELFKIQSLRSMIPYDSIDTQPSQDQLQNNSGQIINNGENNNG